MVASIALATKAAVIANNFSLKAEFQKKFPSNTFANKKKHFCPTFRLHKIPECILIFSETVWILKARGVASPQKSVHQVSTMTHKNESSGKSRQSPKIRTSGRDRHISADQIRQNIHHPLLRKIWLLETSGRPSPAFKPKITISLRPSAG